MSISVFVSAIEIGPLYIGSLAGTRRYAYSLVQSLAKQDVEIHVVSTNKLPQDNELLENQNIHLYTIPQRKPRKQGFRKYKGSIRRDSRYFSRKALKVFEELAKTHTFSLIHTIDLSAIAFLRAKKRDKLVSPIITSISNPIVAAGLRIALMTYSDRIVYTNNKSFVRSFPPLEDLKKKSIIIPLSIDCKKLSQIPKLEDLEEFRKKYDLNQEKKTILLLGPFIPRKLQKDIIKFFPKILEHNLNSFFLIAGDGPTLNSIKEEIIQLKIDQYVSIAGYIPDNELLLAYHECSILLYPAEGGSFGTPVIESMASGLPILAADRPPMNEMIETESLYPVDKKQILVEMVIRLLANEEMSQKISFENKKTALKMYDHGIVGKKIVKIYQECVK